MPFSWDETRRNLDAAAQAAQRKRQADEAATAQRLKDVREQYELMQQRLIQPFIAAMRAAGSPGLKRRPVPNSGQEKWKKKSCWRAGPQSFRNNVWIDIFPDGKWLYYDGGYEANAGGPGAYHTSSEYHDSTIDPNYPYPWLIPDAKLQQLQEWMVMLMRQHRVLLPRD